MVEATAWACALAPDNCLHRWRLGEALQKWREELQPLMPPHSPPLRIEFPPRRFPALPEIIERQIIELETMDNILKDCEMNQRWWQPLRQGLPVSNFPARITVRHGPWPTCACKASVS